jgi:hypothetical protein
MLFQQNSEFLTWTMKKKRTRMLQFYEKEVAILFTTHGASDLKAITYLFSLSPNV